MPFQPHYRVTALGRLGGSGERFSYSLALAPNDGSGSAEGAGNTFQNNQAAWEDVAEDIRSFHAAGATRILNLAVLEEVKVARIGADGKYLSDPLLINVTDTPGGSTGDNVPYFFLPQTALAVSLVTSRRGPTGKGRFYIPMPVVGVTQPLFEADPALLGGIQAQAATLIENINNAPGIDGQTLAVCVASTKGYNSKVTGVRMGRVVDTMRSRRAQLLENHTAPTAIS